jgi:hypothetical protein
MVLLGGKILLPADFSVGAQGASSVGPHQLSWENSIALRNSIK